MKPIGALIIILVTKCCLFIRNFTKLQSCGIGDYMIKQIQTWLFMGSLYGVEVVCDPWVAGFRTEVIRKIYTYFAYYYYF